MVKMDMARSIVGILLLGLQAAAAFLAVPHALSTTPRSRAAAISVLLKASSGDDEAASTQNSERRRFVQSGAALVLGAGIVQPVGALALPDFPKNLFALGSNA